MNIEEKILKECDTKECNGNFYVVTDEIKNCKCFEKLVRYDRYDKALIPSEFWNFKKENIVEEFSKDILEQYDIYKADVKLFVDEKVDFLFWGSVGTGKTTIAILMLKDALDLGYKGILISGFEVINYVYKDRKNELDECDFIVIDEIDKIVEKTLNDFCNVVSSYLGKKAIILLSNADIKKLRDKNYPEFFLDRLKELELVKFKPGSYRGKFASKFKKIVNLKK